MFNFSDALIQLKSNTRMSRAGWNGKNMFIEMQVPDENSKMSLPYLFLTQMIETCAPDAVDPTPPVIGFRVPWLASQTDILAADWYVSDFNGKELHKVQLN